MGSHVEQLQEEFDGLKKRVEALESAAGKGADAGKDASKKKTDKKDGE